MIPLVPSLEIVSSIAFPVVVVVVPVVVDSSFTLLLLLPVVLPLIPLSPLNLLRLDTVDGDVEEVILCDESIQQVLM